MSSCLFDSPLVWTLIDTLASFCIAVNPHIQNEVWWSTWGGRLCVMNTQTRQARQTIVVDSSNAYGRITNIVFDPLNSNVVYASGLLMQGVYRSTNSGRTWEVIRRHEHYLTNYVGECLHVVRRNDGVRIVSANFSRGELEYSDDNGQSWSSALTGLTGSICSVYYDSTMPEQVVLGCKYGKVIVSNLHDRTSSLVHVLQNASYCEVPRIRRSVDSPSVLFGISAGFDSEAAMPGLFQSCDGGQTWEKSWLQGVSLWALECCGCGSHVIVGGFSEFDYVVGRGIVAILNVYDDSVEIIGGGIPWYHGITSVWDVAICSDLLAGPNKLFIATEDGVYLGYTSH